jgi:hypothetical protein
MLRKIKRLYINTLARIVPAKKVDGNELERSIVHRRVEVKMERETVTIVAPSQPAEGAGDTVSGASAGAARPPRSLKP